MPLGTILLVLLVLLLIGGLLPFGGPVAPSAGPYHGYGYGWGTAGVLGPILVVLLVLVLLGAI